MYSLLSFDLRILIPLKSVIFKKEFAIMFISYSKFNNLLQSYKMSGYQLMPLQFLNRMQSLNKPLSVGLNHLFYQIIYPRIYLLDIDYIHQYFSL